MAGPMPTEPYDFHERIAMLAERLRAKPSMSFAGLRAEGLRDGFLVRRNEYAAARRLAAGPAAPSAAEGGRAASLAAPPDASATIAAAAPRARPVPSNARLPIVSTAWLRTHIEGNRHATFVQAETAARAAGFRIPSAVTFGRLRRQLGLPLPKITHRVVAYGPPPDIDDISAGAAVAFSILELIGSLIGAFF